MRVYLDFIRRRATGELQTGAEWMRTFVKAHPGAWDASRTDTRHGVRAATRLTLRSSRPSPAPQATRATLASPKPSPTTSSARASTLGRAAARSPRCRRTYGLLAFALHAPSYPIFPLRRQEPALLGQQFIPPLRTDDAWCARRSSEVPSEEASSSSLRPTASSHRPPPPSPRPSAGTCRWGGRATVRSK